MAVVDLALHSEAKPVALADIAEWQEISLSYLEQLFAKLRRGGQVKGVRGPGGGYLLARCAAETRIPDIIISVDKPIRATRCSAGSPKGRTGTSGGCATRDLWEELSKQIHLFLSLVTVADVCDKRVLGASGILHREQKYTAEAR